jgi:hypothetical protein
MFVEPIYKGFRIQVEAVEVDDRWDATVNIHRVFSDEKAHVEQVTCRSPLNSPSAWQRSGRGAGWIFTDWIRATSNCQILRH